MKCSRNPLRPVSGNDWADEGLPSGAIASPGHLFPSRRSVGIGVLLGRGKHLRQSKSQGEGSWALEQPTTVVVL